MNAAENKVTRAGRYVRRPTGYRAFLPAPLPPDPPVDLSGKLHEQLSAADYALGRLDGAVLTLPHPDLFVFMYVRKEAVLSSSGKRIPCTFWPRVLRGRSSRDATRILGRRTQSRCR